MAILMTTLLKFLPRLFTPDAPAANVAEDSLPGVSLMSWLLTLSPILMVAVLAATCFFCKVFKRSQEEPRTVQVNINLNINIQVITSNGGDPVVTVRTVS